MLPIVAIAEATNMDQFKLKFQSAQNVLYLDEQGEPSVEGKAFDDLLTAHEAATLFCMTHPPTDKLVILHRRAETDVWQEVGFI